MKTKKNFARKALSIFLCLLLTLSTVLVAGIATTSAGAEEGIYLRGNMNGWNCYEQYKFVDEGNGIFTLVLDMTGGNYEFKIATPTWSVSIGNEKNDDDNAHLVIEADSIIKFTANTKTRDYTAESMNTKSDFTLGATAQTIEAENYTYALGAVSVWEDSNASAGKYVGAFDEGDSLNYGVTVSGDKAQTYRFEISVASETDNGEFDFTAGEDAFPVSFSSSGAWQTYKTVVVTKTLNPGYNRITIDNVGGTYNVDKIVVTPVSAADAVAKGETTLNFAGFDAASDTALIKDGVFTNAGVGEYVSLIVKPELDGVYTVTLDCEKVLLVVNGMKYESGDSVVLEGETELLVFANEANATVSKVDFKYVENVEQMGYLIRDGKTTGYRFANTFAIDKIVITAPAVDGEENDSKVILSNGKVIDTTDMYKDGAVNLEFETAENITWFVYDAANASQAYINVFGTKDMASATDIALGGYTSTVSGWCNTAEYPYETTVVSEGKLGFGFDKEVTVEKIVVIGKDNTIPAKATLTTADNKKVEITGTKVNNDVVFEIEDTYSFGFYLDFGKEVTYTAIQVYGDDSYKGASKNVSSVQDYTLFANGLTEDDSRVVANTGDHILTSETGSDREWNYNPEIVGEAPYFHAPNTPLAEAAYNLTMEEIFKSINYDETFGDVFYTGTNWHKVWTRDTAISMQYILSWMFPEISTNCANAKVVGKDGNLTFEEDTGTGGSYPVSTDRIIMMLAVWETYLADGNLETLEYFYEVASNTIEQDYTVVYDKEAGLFRGETCGLDHRDKTYGDWTGEDDQNGIVNIAESKAASTNIIYCQAMKILAEAAEILDKEDEAVAWAELAADLEDAIAKRLWHDELGTYSSWEYPDWMGSPLAYKQDVLANGYAVWYNIGGQEKSDSIMENHTLVNFGANTVYPQKNAARWTDYKYHDSGVWPGWEALLMIGAVNNANENNLLAEEIWNSCIRGAVACLTNYEVIDYETGEGLHSTQQLWSVAATMAGYYRVLFGMEYTTEGITFDPYVPEWMDGPFYAGNYKYRDAVLDLELIGRGDTVAEMYVNGEKVANDYVLPTNAKGEYSIKIVLSDSGAEDIINLKAENTAKAPNAPNRVTLSGGKLTWNAVNNCTYKVWTGTEYVDVDTTSYTIDTTKYGVYSVVAVDKTTGIWSELSAPKEYNPTGTKVTVNANNYYDKSPAVSGAVDNENTKTVYFTNNKGWSTVNIFFWGGSTEAGWPGEAMNYVGKNEGGEDVYCYSIPKDTPNIIFNNGSEQTVDITTGVEDNAGFYLDKNNGKWTVGTWTNETFKPSDGAGAAGGFTTKVTIPSDGVYQLSVIHSNQGDPTAGITAAIRSVYIDGEDVGSLVFPAMSFTKQTSSHLRLELTKGEHEITIKYDTDNWFDRNMSQAHGGRDNNVTYHTIQFARTGDIVEKPIVTLVTGDADGDSKVNVKDATAIQKHVAGLITLTADGVKAADVDANTQVNVKDATAIQKHIAGIDTGFDIEKPFEK
ncbi:MAG: starch-binding protein [Ruminococcaceae bacterium]|nr:starch-binding protein [Oscillospiraceae bacterium]